jgi:hypothetical protein
VHKGRRRILNAALVLVIAAIILRGVSHTDRMHIAGDSDGDWEYKTVKTSAERLSWREVQREYPRRETQRLEDQRWELVAAFATHQGYGQSRDIVTIFKREKR